MKRFIGIFLLIMFAPAACYNTYYISRAEMEKLERSDKTSVWVKDIHGKRIQVKETSRLFVRSKGGKRYQLTPFNFKLTKQQLVASDRDYILDVNGLKEGGEIDTPSIWKNALWISGGVLAVAGLIIAVVLTSGSKSFE